MTGIRELLLTIALDFTSDKINKLIKGKETLVSDLLRSYNDALKEWSKNDDIRRMTARNFSTHFKQLGEHNALFGYNTCKHSVMSVFDSMIFLFMKVDFQKPPKHSESIWSF